MYGTRLSDAHVDDYVRHNIIKFFDYDKSKLKLGHYRLSPGILYKPGVQKPDGSHSRTLVHDFSDGAFEFKPFEYLIIVPLERIILPEGMIGEVIGASTLVEQCFDLTAGKLDPQYGELRGRSQDFIMGIKNLLNEPNEFHPERGIANISFVDFRGTTRLNAGFSSRDIDDYRDREHR